MTAYKTVWWGTRSCVRLWSKSSWGSFVARDSRHLAYPTKARHETCAGTQRLWLGLYCSRNTPASGTRYVIGYGTLGPAVDFELLSNNKAGVLEGRIRGGRKSIAFSFLSWGMGGRRGETEVSYSYRRGWMRPPAITVCVVLWRFALIGQREWAPFPAPTWM